MSTETFLVDRIDPAPFTQPNPRLMNAMTPTRDLTHINPPPKRVYASIALEDTIYTIYPYYLHTNRLLTSQPPPDPDKKKYYYSYAVEVSRDFRSCYNPPTPKKKNSQPHFIIVISALGCMQFVENTLVRQNGTTKKNTPLRQGRTIAITPSRQGRNYPVAARQQLPRYGKAENTPLWQVSTYVTRETQLPSREPAAPETGKTNIEKAKPENIALPPPPTSSSFKKAYLLGFSAYETGTCRTMLVGNIRLP